MRLIINIFNFFLAGCAGWEKGYYSINIYIYIKKCLSPSCCATLASRSQSRAATDWHVSSRVNRIVSFKDMCVGFLLILEPKRNGPNLITYISRKVFVLLPSPLLFYAFSHTLSMMFRWLKRDGESLCLSPHKLFSLLLYSTEIVRVTDSTPSSPS